MGGRKAASGAGRRPAGANGDASRSRRHLASAIGRVLARAIPEPRCELAHHGAWQLLIATILSAQCTDERVNAVTPELFRRWPNPKALGAASLPEVETVIRSTGFYRNKAKSIVATSRLIADDFGGEVPRTLEELTELPGVARKTANLVLGTGYGIATGIVVDTHVGRVSRRLGLSASEDPVEIERDLCALYPCARWIEIGHRILLHGRYVCLARAPRCEACPLNEDCASRERPAEGTRAARAAGEQRVVERRGDG